MPRTYPTEAKAEEALIRTVLPDLRKKMKAMRESLPMLEFTCGRLKADRIVDCS